MLKIAGWIISDAAVEHWSSKHPGFENRPSQLSTALKVQDILNHRDLKSFPYPQENFIYIQWPKMTPEARGTSVCFLVRRVNFNTKNETWDNFTPIEQNTSQDDKLVEWLRNDGLTLGEWATVPDPLQSDWPFAKRHPGKRCPPEDIGTWRYKPA